MKHFLLYLWQLPQNIVALLYYAYLIVRNKVYYKANEIEQYKKYATVIVKKSPGCVTLGKYIFVSFVAYDIEYKGYYKRTLDHEYGHVLQSLYTGPLYLLIIGIPSIVHAMLWPNIVGGSYYDFFTERWANKLGGVDGEKLR